VYISDSHHSSQYNSNMLSLRPVSAISSLFLYSSQRTFFFSQSNPLKSLALTDQSVVTGRSACKVTYTAEPSDCLRCGGPSTGPRILTETVQVGVGVMCAWLADCCLRSVQIHGGGGRGIATKSIVALRWPGKFPSSYNRKFQSPFLVAISVT